MTVPITNSIGATVNNITVSVTGGGNASYGNINDGQTVSRQINYTIPSSAVCGSLFTVTINITSSNGTRTETRSFRLGKPNFSGTTQNFDSVTAPALPFGWSQENSGANTGWVTSTNAPSSAPNSAFNPSPALDGQADLNTTVNITSATAQLSFKNFYNTESTWDGMVLEIQIGSGAFQDIIVAGGSFVSGGYNIMMAASSPFGARQAWSGNSTNFLDTVINLPATANGQTVNLRWRAASDESVTPSGIAGHKIDDVVITGGLLLNADCEVGPTATSKARADFDGDGKTDMSVFRPDNGNWYLNRTQAGFTALAWGIGTDKLVPGDYDGDGKTDTAVMRPNAANTAAFFHILNSGNSTLTTIQWGLPTDIPAIGDYDGDGKSDVAVFRPSDGSWYVSKSSGGTISTQFGQTGDIPVANDFDGDGKTDIAVFRNGIWYVSQSSGGIQTISFGLASDKAVPADYDGDGKTDVAVYRPSDGTWYLLRSQQGFASVQFGNSSDVPVPGDYDGDGKSDVAVFRGGAWYVNRTTAGFLATDFGVASDSPIPKQYIP